ncbi:MULTISPECIES: polysaccharide deacetylase family protein [Streptomyces]|uniref:Deacetylase n=1 Tax=Streptomyces hygroscopicus TaxID=1912 RepID=A0ABQ3U0V4_STRHY|nr:MULTISPECIES: polysaccharide deacetylase family protein [Streptomyces]MCO8304894.1 polysaccharide deacetylase family protein [Streptomyces sp. RKCA744]GHJ29235.1 deacetylase [Streptomyces hygroscopicus]
MGRKGRISGLLAGAVCLTLGLTGCGASYDTTSPRSAREHAASEAAEPEGATTEAAAPDRAKKGGGADPVDCAVAKCVALTFDAGPSENTPRLLDILKREHAHATFFMLGKNHIVKHPDLVHRIADEGHELANHTWSHKILTKTDSDEVRTEISRVQDAVAKLTGSKPLLMRPPQGRTDERVSKICRELGVAQVLWSVTAKDYQTTDSALIRKRVLDQTKRDGIILLHDIYKGTVPAVPGILADLKKEGYTVVTVSQLMAPATPEPGKVYRP